METSAVYRVSTDRLGRDKRSKYGLDHKASLYDVKTDDQAFIELQQYADFQNILSKKLCDDLDKDEIYSSRQPPLLLENDAVEGDFPFQKYHHPALTISHQKPQLPSPVVIPVRKAEDHGSRLVRAYAPSLMECGINQNTFLHFIDTFNASIRGLPTSDIGDITTLDPSLRVAGSMDSVLSSSAVLAAEKVSISSDQSTSIMNLANEQLFNPHGLHAMVINPSPDAKVTSPVTDTKSSHLDHSANVQSFHARPSSTARLVFLEDYMPSLKKENIDRGENMVQPGQRRRRRKSSTSTMIPEILPSTRRSPKKRFSAAIRGAVSGSGKAERAFMERVKAKENAKSGDEEENEMDSLMDAPYLLVMNYPISTRETISYLDQKMDEPPPMYEKRMPAQRQFRRRQDYCVPTL